jgi:hypothetical protein
LTGWSDVLLLSAEFRASPQPTKKIVEGPPVCNLKNVKTPYFSVA